MKNKNNSNIKKRFIECFLPCSVCNLRCEYCYVIQQERRNEKIEMTKYPIDHMINGLTKERLGGACFFSICAVGETLLPDYIIPLVEGLLKQGHFVNITNNGTITNKINEFCKMDKALLKHLHFSFSFHYLELKKKNLVDTFFNNVKTVKEAGCSFIVKLNLCDNYINVIDDIKKTCIEKIGCLPVVSITRKEMDGGVGLYTDNYDKYIKCGMSFNSNMFDLTKRFFNEKRCEFCYAGDWSFLLNFETGIMSKCYSNQEGAQDIFKDINKPILFEAVGKHCNSKFCVNADHFITQGVIPEIECGGYADIRTDHGRNWCDNEMFEFLNQKLSESNNKYCFGKKLKLNLHYCFLSLKGKLSRVMHKK